MIWPFSKIAELEGMFHRAQADCNVYLKQWNDAEERARNALEKATGMGGLAVERGEALAKVLAERDALKAEVEELKKPKTPTGPYYSCQCGSHRFVTAGHIIGWKRGEDRAIPIPLGGLLHCVDCGSIWSADDDGMERSKGLPPAQVGGGKREKPPPPPPADEDLRWDARERR